MYFVRFGSYIDFFPRKLIFLLTNKIIKHSSHMLNYFYQHSWKSYLLIWFHFPSEINFREFSGKNEFNSHILHNMILNGLCFYPWILTSIKVLTIWVDGRDFEISDYITSILILHFEEQDKSKLCSNKIIEFRKKKGFVCG